MENTGKKGRKWLGVRNWGRQLGECQWADTRGILQTVAGSREAQGEAAKPVPPKWGPAGQGPAPRGAERSEGSAPGCGWGWGLVTKPKSIQGVTVPSMCTCHWSVGTFQLQGVTQSLCSALCPHLLPDSTLHPWQVGQWPPKASML